MTLVSGGSWHTHHSEAMPHTSCAKAIVLVTVGLLELEIWQTFATNSSLRNSKEKGAMFGCAGQGPNAENHVWLWGKHGFKPWKRCRNQVRWVVLASSVHCAVLRAICPGGTGWTSLQTVRPLSERTPSGGYGPWRQRQEAGGGRASSGGHWAWAGGLWH